MIVQITPIALNNIGYRTYIIFAVLNACWVPLIWCYFPETKGLELEDVDGLFERMGGARVKGFRRGVGGGLEGGGDAGEVGGRIGLGGRIDKGVGVEYEEALGRDHSGSS
jgi:hypothetical protein